MTQVEILYNSYAAASRIRVNGQPIDRVSTLSRFQTLPFAQWYEQLLGMIEREVNDDFSLRLLARPAEGQLLQPLVSGCPACISYQRSNTPLGDPALRRLRHLSQRISTGAVPACPRQKFVLRIYCDDPAAMARDAGVARVLPRLAFCKPELQTLARASLRPSDAEATVLVTGQPVTGEELSRLRDCAPGTTCVICVGAASPPAVREDIYRVGVASPADLPAALEDFLEYSPYVELLHRAVSSYRPGSLGLHQAEVAALEAVEPQITVQPVTLLEVGQKIPLPVQTYPPQQQTPALRIRSSTRDVVAEQDGCLIGVGVGKCMVSVSPPGEQRLLAEFQVTVIQRNRITALTVQPSSLDLEMGTTARVKVSYQPENADNASRLRYRSTGGLVAVVDERGCITPRSPGRCDIIAEAEGVTARCSVTVRPRLQAFAVDPPVLQLRAGEVARVNFSRVPQGALPTPVKVDVSAPETVVYDFQAGMLEAKQAGTCLIRYTSQDGRVTAQLEVTVLPPPAKGFLARLLGG